MAILDKQGLQHYANKMCNADNRKVGSKSLPTALNDIDTAIDGFKTLFETEYGTPVNMELENNENIFSVGTGTNVDKRSKVENSFTDVELSGNSLVNLSATKQLLNQTSTHYDDVYLCETSRLKANTSYRLEYDFECNIDFTFSKCYLGYSISKTGMRTESSIKFDAKKGKNILNFTLTQSELDNAINNNFQYFMVRVFIDSDKKEKTYSTKNVMLLEGDYTNKPIPQYFEGLKSIGEKEDGNHKIEILLQNKNLFNYEEYYKHFPSTKTDDKTILSHSGDLKGGNHNFLFMSPMNVTLKPNTTYTFCIFNLNDSYQALKCEGCLSTKQSELGLNVPIGQIGYKVFTTNSTNYKDGVSFKLNTSTGEKAKYKIMIVEGDIRPSNYIHYDSNKKEILLNEPLRGLPNGVKDTIEKINGEWKIVRRCSEYVLNGSEWG